VVAKLSSCSQCLDADLAGIERALQRGPAVIPGQKLGGVENEVAAIRPMQSARDQQVEIRDESAEPRHVLGPADECLVRRIVLVDNRRTVLSAIIYNDVDPIAAEPRILDCGARRGRQLRTWQLCRWAEEVVGVSFTLRSTVSMYSVTLGKSR